VLDGTRSLSLVPVGDDNRFALRSSWPHPSFGGAFSPVSREVDDAGFSAQWAVSALASQAQTQLRKALAGEHGGSPERVEISLVDPVDVYTMASRATKYGVLFIVLTFVGFGLMDVVRRLNIHPVQYLLVGMALTLFFLLLLSLSEQLPFALAYLAASSACIGIQSYYLAGVLRSWPRALGFVGLLTVLYSALYGLLVSEQNALLLGSLLLFAVLAAVMAITRRIDWHALGKGNG
jgi:inner membrane protein